MAANALPAIVAVRTTLFALPSWMEELGRFTFLSAVEWCAILSALAALWWLSAIMLRRGDEDRPKEDHPGRLFRELCKVHRLSWNETALLQQLSDERGLVTPSLLFVREEYFAGENAATEATQRLRMKLFGEAPT
jgi:hypothetical protein